MNLFVIAARHFFDKRLLISVLLAFWVITETQSSDKKLLILVSPYIAPDIDANIFSEWTRQLEAEGWIVKIEHPKMKEAEIYPHGLKETMSPYREPGSCNGVILLGPFERLTFKHGEAEVREYTYSDLWYICDDTRLSIKWQEIPSVWVTGMPASEPLPRPACWLSRIDFYGPHLYIGKYINAYLKANTQYRMLNPASSDSPVFVPAQVEPSYYKTFDAYLNSNNNSVRPEDVMVLIRSPDYKQSHSIENACVGMLLLNQFQQKQHRLRCRLRSLISQNCPQTYSLYDHLREAIRGPYQWDSVFLLAPAQIGADALRELSEQRVPVLGRMSELVLDACHYANETLSAVHNVLPVVVGDATLSPALLSEVKQ